MCLAVLLELSVQALLYARTLSVSLSALFVTGVIREPQEGSGGLTKIELHFGGKIRILPHTFGTTPVLVPALWEVWWPVEPSEGA